MQKRQVIRLSNNKPDLAHFYSGLYLANPQEPMFFPEDVNLNKRLF